MHELALHNAWIEQGTNGTALPRRVGIGVGFCWSEVCVNERALPPAALGQIHTRFDAHNGRAWFADNTLIYARLTSINGVGRTNNDRAAE